MTASMRRGGEKMGEYQGAMARMNGSIIEFVRGLPVIRTFNRTGETFAETATRSAPRRPSRPSWDAFSSR